jgi:cell wall-associated NlpC family hydrolase
MGMIEEARKLLGVPFVHQGRHLTCGVDCIGLLVLAARADGQRLQDYATYSRRPKPTELLANLEKNANRIDLDDVAAGDLLVFCVPYRGVPQHLGIATDEGTLIHTDAHVGRVVEVSLTVAWMRRAHSAWRLRGGDQWRR